MKLVVSSLLVRIGTVPVCTTLLRGRDFLRAFINFELGPLEVATCMAGDFWRSFGTARGQGSKFAPSSLKHTTHTGIDLSVSFFGPYKYF